MIVVILVTITTIGLLGLISNNNNSKSNGNNVVTKVTADDLKSQAIKALQSKNIVKAKQLFEQANQEYKKLNDTNNVIDTDAQLYLLNHPKQ